MFPIRDVLHALAPLNVQAPRLEGAPEGFSAVRIDSRTVGPGDLFIALPGEQSDGHRYLHDAVARGARGVIVVPQRLPAEAGPFPDGVAVFPVRDTLQALQALAACWRSRFTGVQVTGVTGSVGKTSTKEAVAAVIGQRYRVLKNEGNQNNEVGLPLTLLCLDGTQERAVLEMGMYTLGEIALLCELARPSIGVVTNVGPVHLERLGTIERIAQAKRELPERLPAEGVAVLNGDDPRVRAMAQHTPAGRVLYYGLGSGCDVRATDLEPAGLAGFAFRLHWEGQARRVQTRLLGAHHVMTCLAAAAVGFAEGLDWDEVTAGLTAVEDRVRTQVRPGLGGSTIIDDTYNASPASVLAALDLLRHTETGRRIAVLGDMRELGSYEEEGHREVGRRAAAVADWLVAVGERGRTIGEEARRCGSLRVDWAATNEEAADLLASALGPRDVVLVKGSRGMAMEQVVARLIRTED
ncbi:MAG: UDP-N-acetylmuramoyl-tripeptide--D-alanyl-D-alanine ligase [Chloroflexi bacterium]|nr:UDP-N-acetylmuramoyl-tripeptide--D-alanyl-D-alanine ligase [Chloroflexota bacterium]